MENNNYYCRNRKYSSVHLFFLLHTYLHYSYNKRRLQYQIIDNFIMPDFFMDVEETDLANRFRYFHRYLFPSSQFSPIENTGEINHGPSLMDFAAC